MDKHCSGCSTTKELSEFYKKPRHDQYSGLAGYSHQCKLCTKAARLEYVRNNPDKQKNSNRAYRLNKYGISVGEFNRIFNEQEGKCLGCQRHQSEFSKRLAVDHDHSTGQVRGLLCAACNLILGHAQDNSDVLVSLIKYLEKSQLAKDKSNVVEFSSTKKVG